MIRPWLDRNGKLSALRSLVFGLLFVPLAYLLALFLTDGLGPRPVTEFIHETGLWTLRLIFLSLAVTPLRQLWRWPQIMPVRRMIGVAAACYGGLHLFGYMLDESFDLGKIATEILVRFYLTIGAVALLGLLALAVTSTDGMVRRLGGRRWRVLHYLAYPIGLLATIHFFLQSKLDVAEPVVMAGLFLWLMGYRLLRRGKTGPSLSLPAALALSLAALLLTFGFEAVFFWLRNGIDPSRVLLANLSFGRGPRPGWWVGIAGLGICVIAAGRSLQQARRPASRSAPTG